MRPITKCQTAIMAHEACRSLATTARVCRSARCAEVLTVPAFASHSDLIAGCLLTHRTAWPCAGPYQGGSATARPPRVNTHPEPHGTILCAGGGSRQSLHGHRRLASFALTRGERFNS